MWGFKVQMFLVKENLSKHITDDSPNPLNNDSTKKCNNNKAIATIILTLKDSIYLRKKWNIKATMLVLKTILNILFYFYWRNYTV